MTTPVLLGCILALPFLGQAARIARTSADLGEAAYTEEMREAAVDDRVECEKWFESLPAGMKAAYPDAKFLNSGVRGCGFIATDAKQGATVVIKVAKGWPGNPRAKWENECNKMKRMHEAACQQGPAVLALAQTYLPTCIDFMPYAGAGEDPVPYFVMHAAPTTQFHAVGQLRLDEAARKEAFAQLVAAVYSLHRAGWYHNDLHSRNVMIGESSGHPEIAIIDFGKANQKAETGGYHHDASSLLEHLQRLVGCGGKFLQCLEEKWGVDKASMKVIESWLANTKEHKQEQEVQKLFSTAFVQGHLQHQAKRPYRTRTSCSEGRAPEAAEAEDEPEAQEDAEPADAATEAEEVEPLQPSPEGSAAGEPSGAAARHVDAAVTTEEAAPTRSASCKAPENPGCSHLSGLCCPAANGKMLACCK